MVDRIVKGDVFLFRDPKKGWTVIAERAFKAGELIIRNVVVKVSSDDSLSKDWRMDSGSNDYDVLSLGVINLMNHWEDSNTIIERDSDVFTAFAKRDIEAGEELTIQYDCDLWFDPLPPIKV